MTNIRFLLTILIYTDKIDIHHLILIPDDMANVSPEARSILKTVELEGVAVIQQKRLLWAIGWSQDRPGAWKELLDLWEEMGHERDTLIGVASMDKLVFFPRGNLHTQLDPVAKWSGESK